MKTAAIVFSVICMIYSSIFNVIYPVHIYTLLGGSTDIGVFEGAVGSRVTAFLSSTIWWYIDVAFLGKILGFVVLFSSLIGSIVLFIPEERIGEKKFTIAFVCGVVFTSIIVFLFYINNIYAPNYALNLYSPYGV